MKTAPDILQSHEALCEELLILMTAESQTLTNGDFPNPEDLLRKQALLPQLESSVEDLKAINASGDRGDEAQRALIARLRKQMMRLFLLDRENEKLMRKRQNEQRTPHANLRRGTPHQAQAAYNAQLRAVG